MSIVALKKLTLCGLKAEKTEALKKLQILGCAHLVSLNRQSSSTAVATQKHTERVAHALKYLNQCRMKRHQVSDKSGFDLDEVVQKVFDVQAGIRELGDQRDFLIKRIKEISPWGDFYLPEKGDLGGIKCWFYIIPKRQMKLLNKGLIYQVVHKDNIHYYTVILAEQEPLATDVPVPRTHTGTVPLSQLKKDLQITELAIEDRLAERQSLTRWIALIGLSLADNKDKATLKMANALTLDEQGLFAIQAWVPVTEIDKLKDFASHNGLALLIEEIRDQDNPPTLLKNAEPIAGGQEVITFYQTPAYRTWDPSAVVFFSFAFFFAMILSDAGYAAIFLLILAFKWGRLGSSLKGKRLRMLAIVTVIFSLLWGIMTGGYFGYTPGPETLAGRIKILDINDFDSMMRLSIAVGAVHIIMANLIKAYQLKGKKTALAALGWVCLIIAGFLLWLAIDGTQYAVYSLFTLGGILLLFFSSERVVNKPSDYLWQMMDGIKNITGLTKIFGDILSYMRLFALGLASASLALTFNQLAEQVYSSPSGLGLLFSILILVLGHTLNLMLCLMSGVVHGLRLNFIEFYNWSTSDEGYPFKAFSKTGRSE